MQMSLPVYGPNIGPTLSYIKTITAAIDGPWFHVQYVTLADTVLFSPRMNWLLKLCFGH